MTPSQRSDERPPNPNSADSRRLYAPVGTIVKVFISGMMPRRSDSALPRSNQLMLPERAAPFAGTPVSSRPPATDAADTPEIPRRRFRDIAIWHETDMQWPRLSCSWAARPLDGSGRSDTPGILWRRFRDIAIRHESDTLSSVLGQRGTLSSRRHLAVVHADGRPACAEH